MFLLNEDEEKLILSEGKGQTNLSDSDKKKLEEYLFKVIDDLDGALFFKELSKKLAKKRVHKFIYGGFLTSSKSITIVNRLTEDDYCEALQKMNFKERLKEKTNSNGMQKKYAVMKFDKYARLNPLSDYEIVLMHHVTYYNGAKTEEHYSLEYRKI